MDNPFEWLTSKFTQPLSLAFFLLGALLMFLGIATNVEIPILKQIAAEPHFRLISITVGLGLVLISIFIAYRPPPEPKINQEAGNLPIPDDLRKSFSAKRDAIDYRARQKKILEFVISEATRYGSVSQESVEKKFAEFSGSEIYYRLEYLRLLCFIEKAGENVYRLSNAYEQERKGGP